jgi:hypothetical protein
MLGVGLASYIPYWSIGVNDTGPVKTYELLLPLSVLTILGAERAGRGAPGWLAACLIAAAVIFWPPQIQHLRSLAGRVRAPLAAVERDVEPPALVFVKNVQPPARESWVYGRPNPRPDLSDPVLFVRDFGPENVRLWRRYPNRRAYRLVYDKESGFRALPLGGR